VRILGLIAGFAVVTAWLAWRTLLDWRPAHGLTRRWRRWRARPRMPALDPGQRSNVIEVGHRFGRRTG
jgi:hypothetical protein